MFGEQKDDGRTRESHIETEMFGETADVFIYPVKIFIFVKQFFCSFIRARVCVSERESVLESRSVLSGDRLSSGIFAFRDLWVEKLKTKMMNWKES